MRPIVTMIALVLMTASTFSQGQTGASPLEPYLWQKRLMIIFAPSLGDHRLIDQRELNVHAIDGLQARDMVVFAVIGDDHVNPELNRAPAEGAAEIRRRFGIADDMFAVVLVGKDGTEKYRSARPVDLSFIFDIVDGMPMRRREMRERKT